MEVGFVLFLVEIFSLHYQQRIVWIIVILCQSMYVRIPLWITHTKDFTPYTYVRVWEWINVNEKRSSFLPFLFIRDWFSFATMIKRKSTATAFHFFHIFLLPLRRSSFLDSLNFFSPSWISLLFLLRGWGGWKKWVCLCTPRVQCIISK